MTISDALYTYGIKDKKLDKIKRRLKHRRKVKRLYVIVQPLTGDGILEIYVYNQLLQQYYEPFFDSINVLGLALCKADAENIVLQMVQDMYDAGDGENLDMDFFCCET